MQSWPYELLYEHSLALTNYECQKLVKFLQFMELRSELTVENPLKSEGWIGIAAGPQRSVNLASL
jgi:hypothetical protein